MEKFRPAIKQGIIYAIVSTLLFFVLYFVDRLFFGFPAGWLVFVTIFILGLPILFMIIGARDCKANFSPYGFGNAFSAAFTTAMVATVLSTIVQFGFTSFIDKDYNRDVAYATIDGTEELMEMMGATDEMKEEATEKSRAELEAKESFNEFNWMGFLIPILWFALLAVIIGAVQKDQKTDELIA